MGTTAAPGTPVVTVEGLCSRQEAPSACKTVITREDLNRFATVVSPQGTDMAQGRLAVQYARMVVLSGLAEREHLDRNPALARELEFQMKLVRMRILANDFLQKQTISVPAAEVEKYYNEHKDEYEEARVYRLSVPLVVPTDSGRTLNRSAVKSEMEELRKRAVGGENFNQVLQDAYKDLHIQATPPPSMLLTLRRSNVQGEEVNIFNLKPGEISAVLDLPAAMAVVKLESKRPMPLPLVRPEIEAALRESHVKNSISELAKAVTTRFDLEYLGMPSQPDIFSTAGVSPPPLRRSARMLRSASRTLRP